jgi:hypothetical protein
MTLADAREAYRYYSEKTSDIVRQLGFAGIALIWMLWTTGEDGRHSLPRELLTPAMLIVSSLALDLVHYAAGSLVWGAYHRRQEKAAVAEEDDFLAPRSLNWPAMVFFWSKSLAMMAAYAVLLLRVLSHRFL